MWVELLSRIQFAFTISFHILFPAFSVGLATFLMVMEAIWLKTKNPLYLQIVKFWTVVFALTFGMGVVSGIAMEFQLGTNWSGFTNSVGPVLGALFTYEVLTAFFIEAGFLGLMIFGWGRVGPKLHFVSTFLVWFGVTLSAFWILSANSWMQTPAGVAFSGQEFTVKDWWEVIFNPSVMPRYIHMLLAAYLSTAMVIAGVSAYYLLKGKHQAFAKKCFSLATYVILFLIPIQIMIGDDVGLDVHKYQPIKTAAIEANWHTQEGAPLVLFGYPDADQQKNLFAIEIPHLASVINTHEWNGTLEGLTSVPAADRPDVPIVFYSFRIMVGMGLLMLFLGLLAIWQRGRGRLYDCRWLQHTFVYAVPIGFIALLTGWYTAECGRQPWVVYNLVRTADAVSHLQTWQVVSSLATIIFVYGIVFGWFYLRYLMKTIRKGPQQAEEASMPFAYMRPKDKV